MRKRLLSFVLAVLMIASLLPAAVLAVTTAERSPLFPDLPGMKESGVEGYDFTFWFGLFGPAGLPTAVTKKLFDASVQTLNDPDIKAKLQQQGNLAAPSTSPEEFQAWAAKEGKDSKALTERSGAKL